MLTQTFQNQDYMDAQTISARKELKVKFASLFIVSVALIVFIIYLFLPRTAPAGTIVNARPLDNADATGRDKLNDVLSKVEAVNTQYKTLKQLDQDYLRKVVDSANTTDLNTLNNNISEVEKGFITKVENLEITAQVYEDPKMADLLRSFAESFRLVMNDRSSMRAFKTAIHSGKIIDTSKPGTLTIQNEIEARDSRIAVLEGYIRLMENNGLANVSVANKVVANQQNVDVLRSTISALEKKVAGLTEANTALQKDNQISSDALDQMKKTTDNSVALKNHNAVLEKMVSDLSAEVSLTEVDCNMARADDAQIISNSKQRKQLLSNALSTLKNLSATGDADIKKKVKDKLSRLNQIASTIHD